MRSTLRSVRWNGPRWSPRRSDPPLERVVFTIEAHLRGATAKFPTDGPLPFGVAGRRAQVEERGIDVTTQVAWVILERLVTLLEVGAKAAVAGSEQQAGRSVHAHVSTYARVLILAHRRTGGAVAVLGPAVAEEAVSGPRRPKALFCKRGVMGTVKHRGEGQRSTARPVAIVPTSPSR